MKSRIVDSLFFLLILACMITVVTLGFLIKEKQERARDIECVEKFIDGLLGDNYEN